MSTVLRRAGLVNADGEPLDSGEAGPEETEERAVILDKADLEEEVDSEDGAKPSHLEMAVEKLRENYLRAQRNPKDRKVALLANESFKSVVALFLGTKAKIVISIPIAMVDTLVYENFPATLVIIDEAGKLSRLDVLVPMARYPEAAIVLAGDVNQLRPH